MGVKGLTWLKAKVHGHGRGFDTATSTRAGVKTGFVVEAKTKKEKNHTPLPAPAHNINYILENGG